MTKIIVLSAPRSGTHMLVRMISRSKNIPWAVPYQLENIKYIKDTSWVVGIHDKYDNAIKKCSKDIKIICIKRVSGHKESLNRFEALKDFDIDSIINSFPSELTVIYDEIIKSSKKELEKIESILNIKVEHEPWSKRYQGFENWRKYKYDEGNPKLI